MSDITKQAEEWLNTPSHGFQKPIVATMIIRNLLAALNESQTRLQESEQRENELKDKVGLLQEVEEGLRAGILDLSKLCDCKDEPRFKWIRAYIANLKDQLSEKEKEYA